MSKVAVIGNTARAIGAACASDLALADQAGIAVPLHRAFAKILGVLLGVDPWKCGPSLADMDLEGAPEAVKKRMLGL